MKYPRASDIKRHQKDIWTSMLQYFAGLVPFDNVAICVRSMMGDAVLWINREHKELDLEKMKKVIASLKVTVVDDVK